MAGLDDLQRMIFGTGERIKNIVAPDEAPTNYDLYDSEGNKIGTKQRTSSDQSFVGQTTVRDEKGKLITSGDEDFDRVMKKIVDSTTPKIRINGAKNGLVVSGTTEALEYAKAAKLNDYLKKTFQYANFADANVENAVAELNESLRESNEKNLVENAIGGNYDDYKEYKLLLQEMRGTNPTNSQVTVKGYDKDGNVQTWTIKQWIDYYKKAYNIGERQQLLADSYSKYKRDRDFKTWVPFIIMSGGGDQLVNTFAGANLLEKAGIAAGTALSEVAKLGEGATKAVMEAANPFSWHGEGRKNNLNDIAHELGHKADVSLSEAKWITEDDFNKKIDSLVGKNVNDLTEDEAAFLAVALGDKLGGGPFGIGRYTKEFITEEGNDKISREQLEKATSYQDYINARDNLSTITKYKEEINDKNIDQFPLFKPLRDWSEWVSSAAPIESVAGHFAGTMLRMWIESGLVSGLTGGSFNPMNLSDDFAESLVGLLNKTGHEYTAENLSTGIGKFFLLTAAEIPEDIIQTAIDDVMIGRAGDIPEMLTPESLEDNAVQNLIMRLAFTPAHAGYKWVKDKELIKNSAIAAKLRKKIPESWFTNAKGVQSAADNGKIVDLTKNSATILNPDGTTTELDNVAMLHFASDEMAQKYPDVAEMLRKKGLVNDVADSDIAQSIDSAKKAVENGDYSVTNGVSKVAIAPASDPFKGYDAPETRLRAKSFSDDGNLPYVETTDTERMMLPVGKELDSYSHSYQSGFHPDYTNILGKHYDNTALAGALNILMRAGDVNTVSDGGSYTDALRAIYRDKMDGLVQEAMAGGDHGATWFVRYPIDSPESAKADIKSQLQKTIDYHTKLITDIDKAENDARRGTKNIELAKELEEAKIGLMNALGQITDEYGNLKEEVVDKIYEYAKNKGGELGDAIKHVSENGDAITSTQADAVVAGVKEKGLPLDQGIVVEGRLVGDNLLVFSLEPYNETKFLHWSREGLKEDGNIYHIPRGTKIASTGSEGEYLVDVSSGITGDGINKYVNRPNGAKYTPSTEAFDYAKYIIDLDTKGYENFGKEYLEPIGEKDKAANAFYHVVGPGNTTGNSHFNVNVTNAKLRAPENLGAMTSSRPGDILDAIVAGSEVGGGQYERYVNSADTNFNPSYQSLEESISRWITRLTRPEMEKSADPVANSVLSQQVRDWAMYSEDGRQFVSDLEELKDWVNKRGADLNIAYLKNDDKDEFLAKILDLGIKYNNGSFNELPEAFQILNNYQYKAPYKAKKSFVVWRGVNDFGNGVNRNAGELPFGSLKVGDDLVDNGYAYTSLNPYSTRVYSGKNKYYNQLGGYLIRYSVPEGSSVIYFGNPEHFGNKVHAADGGAIVLPRGSRGKVTAITKTPMGTIIDVSLADDAGNFSGLKNALEVFDENFEGAKLKGSKLEKELDRVYGDGSGAMLIGDTADALSKADRDVTISDVRKYLSSGDNADLIYELNRRMYDSKEVTLFRGQPEAGLSRKSDVIDVTSDGYHFTKDPVRAYDFDGNVVRADIDKKYIANEQVGGDEWTRLQNWAESLTEEEIKNLGDDTSYYKLFIDGRENEAVAKSLGKPILERWDENNDLVYTYIPGVDEDFDRSMAAQLLASTEPVKMDLGADSANVEMANRIQQAIDTEPYDKSISEIVADKYKKGAATISEAPDSSSYRWESPDVTKTYNTEEELFADRPVGKNMTETRQWMKNAEAFYMNRYAEQTMPEFSRAYPTVDEQQQFVRNMDYLFDLQKMDKETVESSIGKTYENEGIVYTVKQEDVDFYNNYVEPMMTGLREAGAAGVGATPSTTVGYLPHSDYDPTILTAEDSMQQGVLWREYKGTSTTDDDGNFSTGWLNPDLTARYKTFVDNMLWDSLGDQVIIAKYMEEFNADGLNVAANTVEKMVGGRRRLAHLVSESDSVKDVVKHLTKDGEMPSNEALEKAAKEIGATNVVHDLYRPIYGSAGDTVFQDKSATSVRLNSKGDWMRSLGTGDGTLYDNGGAMLVNGNADAKWMAKQIFEAAENGRELDVKQMFVDYLMQNRRRTAKGADYIAEKWMDKIAQKATDGGISRRALTAELGHMIYGEGANRVFRFIGRMDTSKLTDANRQALDSLLYRHSALSKIKNTSSFSANFNKAANKLISARMKSLFWLNFKNGVLQASECIRLFTEFKLGDALKTIKRLSTDADFRADVDEWVDMLVPERYIKSDSAAATGAMETLADNMSYDGTTLTVNRISADGIRKLGKDFDKFASRPVEMGEAMKNRILIAGILQEAERKGLSGNDMFSFVNQRFERIGLAANEMGRLNASDNPFFRIASNLKTFQIRQMRMYLNNINDMNGKKEAITYILKNVGWKGGMAVALAKLGYSATATLGIDPFDLMDDDYTGVDEDRYRGFDYAMLSPVAKLLLSGGFTGYISDTYWACRKAYEDNATVTEQTENSVKNNAPGFAAPGTSFDDVLDTLGGFIPGYTSGKRVLQMNDLMETGWALSSTGNRMYQAPTNPLDIAAGYAFGRSNTPNARAYYQTPDYLEGLMSNGIQGLGQQIGRELKPIRQLFGDTNAGYRSFDPIDNEGYTDWFNGTAADEQQWASGYYYFRNKVDEAQRKYQESLGRSYSDEDKAALRESFNQQLGEIEDQLNKFTTAYEAKHPEGIDAKKMRNLTNILNLYQPVMTDTEEEAKERELEAGNEALYRYSQAGLPAVNSMKRNDKGEVEEVYSPQLRSALQGEYGLPQEAAAQIRQLYKDKWKDLGKQYRDRVFSTKGTKKKQAIQKEYIDIVRQDLDPIVRLYGNNIWSNEDVENIIDDVFNSMIPKYGQSAKSYLKGIYKDYAGKLVYTESGNETLTQINKLLDQGKTAQAKALARSLKQRVQENKTSLNRSEMEKLQRILND